MQLYRELQTKTWHPGSCNCFIVDKPVKRKIFAAPFKDRIVHHILISELEPCFEKYFIYDSYACRKGKGTHMAIKRLFHFINSQTCNNSQEAWILKMDIKGFFMNIERKKLYEKLELFIETKYRQSLLEKLETDKNKKFKGQWIFDLKEIEEKLSFVKYLIPRIREFLKEELGLTLHPKKIYLQPAKIGVPFLGAYIKPNYIMAGKRVLKNLPRTTSQVKDTGKHQLLSRNNEALQVLAVQGKSIKRIFVTIHHKKFTKNRRYPLFKKIQM